jgi:hypothetical protein
VVSSKREDTARPSGSSVPGGHGVSPKPGGDGGVLQPAGPQGLSAGESQTGEQPLEVGAPRAPADRQGLGDLFV